jgi:hypothetical protein
LELHRAKGFVSQRTLLIQSATDNPRFKGALYRYEQGRADTDGPRPRWARFLRGIERHSPGVLLTRKNKACAESTGWREMTPHHPLWARIVQKLLLQEPESSRIFKERFVIFIANHAVK